MTDTNFKKNFTAAEEDATLILQSQIPGFHKIIGNELELFYEQFKIQYYQAKAAIQPKGQPDVGFGIHWNHLMVSVSSARQFFKNYYNLRLSYEKSVHLLGAGFGRLFGAVQFGFIATNQDIQKLKNLLIEEAHEIQKILKIIHKNLRLVYVPKRILKIYHENPSGVHLFAAEFAQELSR